jgi:CPA2 family monovalent cation:H+ antiporter-2
MHAPAFLTELVVVFGVAVVVVLVLSRLRLPAVAGFIVAGALLGPSGLRLASNSERIQSLAEVGVVLLLFTIGLEFSLERLRRLWRVIALGGALQVGVTTLGVVSIAAAAGEPAARGVFFGFLVALSSTAIVLRALAEKQETDAPHGRLIVGALVFQDLCVVPMMLITPMLGGQGAGGTEILWAFLKAGVLVVGTLLLGRLIVPRLLAVVARARKRELFLMAVLLVVCGISWLTSLAGLSLALGAFLAGIALADSEYGHQALSDVLPFREALASLFFVSVGMLFDASVILDHPIAVLALVVGTLLGKTLAATIAALAMRFPVRVAVLSGIGLAQIGEFSFVLAGVGTAAGLLAPLEMKLFVVMSVVTMAITPLIFRFAPHIAAGAGRLRRLELMLGATSVEESHHGTHSPRGHVVIAGYGVAGRLLADALGRAQVQVIVVEINAEVVRQARARGEPVYYGDVASTEILEHAGVPDAKEFVILINDPDAARRAVATARRVAPITPILVRTRYVLEVDPLLKLGATDVVAEEFESAAEIMARVLRQAGVPTNAIQERITQARLGGTQMARPLTVPKRMLGEIGELRDLKVETFLVREGDWALGRTVAEFHLVVAGAAMIVALRRGGGTRTAPRPFEEFEAEDVIYFVGERLSEARRLLGAGPGEE